MKFIVKNFWVIVASVLLLAVVAVLMLTGTSDVELPELMASRIQLAFGLLICCIVVLLAVATSAVPEYERMRNNRDTIRESFDELYNTSIKLSKRRMKELAFEMRVQISMEDALKYVKLMANQCRDGSDEGYRKYIAIAVINGDAELLPDSSYASYVETVKALLIATNTIQV